MPKSLEPVATYHPGQTALNFPTIVIGALFFGLGIWKVSSGAEGDALAYGIVQILVALGLLLFWWLSRRRGPRLALYADRLVVNRQEFPLSAVSTISEENLAREPENWVRLEIEGMGRIRLADDGSALSFAEALSKDDGGGVPPSEDFVK